MTTRFCPGCRTEVQDAGGFCLLGHRLALEAPTASLQELRAEVDGSFEDADLRDIEFDDDREDVWDRLGEPALAGALAAPAAPAASAPAVSAPTAPAPTAPAPTAPARRVPPPPPPLAPARRTAPPPPPTVESRSVEAPAPMGPAPTAPAPVTVQPPTQAPVVQAPMVPSESSPASARPATASLDSAPVSASPATVETVAPSDPINAFAPAPRMDWGPEKSRLKRRPRRKARTEETA